MQLMRYALSGALVALAAFGVYAAGGAGVALAALLCAAFLLVKTALNSRR